MSITIIFLGLLAVIIVWWLSQQRLASKPWLEEGLADDYPAASASQLPPVKIGLGIFLGVAGSLFALLLSAFVMRANMTAASLFDAAISRPLVMPKLLWLNTGLLLVSSAALQGAQLGVRKRQMRVVQGCLIAAGVLGFAFLAGQLLAWRQLIAAGYFAAVDPVNAFFYVVTGLHGLHVLGGLAVLGRTIGNSLQSAKLQELRLSVELCAIYWHFLFIVWLIFFGLLLLSAPALAAICSFPSWSWASWSG